MVPLPFRWINTGCGQMPFRSMTVRYYKGSSFNGGPSRVPPPLKTWMQGVILIRARPQGKVVKHSLPMPFNSVERVSECHSLPHWGKHISTDVDTCDFARLGEINHSMTLFMSRKLGGKSL